MLFGLLFLAFFSAFHFWVTPLLVSYDWLFGMDSGSAKFLFGLAVLLLLSAYSFVIFASLSQDYRMGIAVALLGGITPLLFNQGAPGVFLAIGYSIVLTGFYFSVENKMKNYITFDPVFLIGGSIKLLTTLLTVILCFGYYLSINAVIAQKGFMIPDSIIPDKLIETIIQQQTGGMDTNVKGDKYIAQITPEMIQYAKDHPEILKQYGVTPEQLDQLAPASASETPPSSSAESPPAKSPAIKVPTGSLTDSPSLFSVGSIKKMALEPINAVIKEYQQFVAPVLAFILFSGFSFSYFLLNLLSGFFIRFIYFILEKTNVIRFEKEMREVKKLVV